MVDAENLDTNYNFIDYFYIFNITINSNAQLSPDMTNKLFDAWSKQTGFDQEAGKSADYLYKRIPENVRNPLAIIFGICDTINKQEVHLEYKYAF